ncbi:DUF6172 family protein [Hydrogenophaga sp. BPS33]|uniref:DUF6172 family protein n=1 Tax=Hydrogenophaga sp. BPS33 TaxID=2651974 RepID=UPI00131FA081|nr:DUF6172 family protein [Hydrogenophaga sp. BPS33]QHE85673.1 hypothetical protein F9K07_12560 [Hydrogenophaga sp. BPS33]
MRKTFALVQEGRHRDRVLEAVKHEIRKYLKRERRRELPEGVDFLDFDCRVGASKETAQVVHLSELIPRVDAVAREGGEQAYVEILAKPGVRRPRTDVVRDHPAQSSDAPDDPAADTPTPAA